MEFQIPKGWKRLPLKMVAPLQRGFDLPIKYLEKGRYPVVYSNGIQNYHDDFQVKAPGVVTGRSGTIGKVTYVNENYWPHNTALWVTDFKNNYPLFVYYLYASLKLERFGTGSGVPTLNRNDVHLCSVLLPPIEEQTAIATALSDVDALIQSLEKLIAKKKLIKQGAMQELLTGEKRLPGFTGEWEVKRLDEIADVKSGKRLPLGTSLTDDETPHPYIRVADMYQGGIVKSNIKYVPVTIFPFIKNYRIFNDDIFISVAGSLGIVGIIPPELDGANLTENANRITNITCDRDFLLYIFMSTIIQGKIESERTLGAQPKLALTRIRKFIIPIPPSIDEQKAIANILSNMDAEICTLEAKLAKCRLIKQGMMQELLTGKTRLI